MHHSLLSDIGIMVVAAVACGLAAHFLRQPVILGYLVAGAVVGPSLGLGLVTDAASVEVIAEIGLILLLFVIGLEMHLPHLKAQGRAVLVTGFAQFPLCVLLGAGAFVALGHPFAAGGRHDALYLAIACALSSTAVVVKLLADRFALDTRAGRITVGVLVVQDVFAILVLAFQPNLGDPSVVPVVKTLGATFVLLASGFLISKHLLSRLFRAIARSPELVVAASLGWCAAVAAAAGAIGLSFGMGALVAGLSIAAFPYSVHVTAKTLPLRDFFLTLFFVSLGTRITPPGAALVWPLAAVVAVTVLTRFLTVYPLLAGLGAGRRTCFLVSLNLAQVSEFSLVIASLGLGTFKHIAPATVDVLIYAMAITAVASSYAIKAGAPLADRWQRLIGRLRPGHDEPAEAGGAPAAPEVVVLGFHRAGRGMLERLAAQDASLPARILVLDFHSEALREAGALGARTLFADISQTETLTHAGIAGAKIILSTIPDMLLKGTSNRKLVAACRQVAPQALIVAMAESGAQEQALRAAGADHVVQVYEALGDELARLVPPALA